MNPTSALARSGYGSSLATMRLAESSPGATPAPWPETASSPSDTRGRMDIRDCEALMRTGSKSFFAASLILPTRVRSPATALYAFCRLADDTIDLESHLHGGPEGALRHLSDRLARIYQGRPSPVPADRALASVVAHFDIPKTLLDALLDGFAWDLQSRRYDTLESLHDYAARVAGTVGSMMAIIMGARSPQAQARACELGVAMQLTNIARDVGEDARAGRLYLPRDWLREAGVDPDTWLASPTFTPAIGAVVTRLLAAADELYERAVLGIAELPRDCRPAIQAARLVYAEIGREVERAGGDSVGQRAFVAPTRKLGLMARAMGAAAIDPAARRNGVSPHPDALPAIAYLVEAAAIKPLAAARATRVRRDPTAQAAAPNRVIHTIGLLERIELRRLESQSFPGAGARATSIFSD